MGIYEDKKPEPVRYWTVTITLTSGDVEQFYVKAKDEFAAYEKADAYAQYLPNIKTKQKGEWRLLP